MRNLKRALSLALASVMLLGMMVVGTSAASYPDIDENDNVEAIEVLNAVKVMIGDRGNFRPDAAVNRHEMATIMAKLVLGVETADNYVGSHPFTDVFPWADKYVAACYENGLVSGTSATTFSGNQPLTAVQAAAMMLRALGYKDLSKGANDWRAPVTAMANQIRLFNGVASNPSEQLNRNQVAQLALNTLKSPMVNLKDNTFDVVNGEGQIVITGGGREYIALSSNEAYARAINDTEKAGTSASQISGWTVELGEHLYNGKLKLNNNYLDVFGRPSRHWEFDGKEIGSYIKEELMVMDNVGKVTGNDLYTLLGSSTIKDYDTLVTIDGVDNKRSDAKDILGYPNGAYFDEADMNRNNKAAVGKTGTGVQTQVFVDHEKDEVYVAIINTYLARADRDYDDKSEEVSLTVYGIEEYRTDKEYFKLKGSSETMKIQSEDFAGLETIQKSDPFLVTVADGAIQTIVEDEVLEGVTLTAFKKDDHVVSGGTEYAYTTTATYDSATLDKYTGDGKENLKDITYDIYLDAYGNLIGIKEIDAVKNYVFLAGIDVDGSNLYSKTATANALFLDGTSKTIKINLAKSDFPTHTALNNTNVVISGDALLNTWCTYSVSSDNVYTVKEVYATRVNPDHPSYGNKDAINADPKNYPGGGDNKTNLAQSWQPAAGLNEDNYTVDVKRMRLHGTTDKSDGTAYANVYGDSTSVYLTADLDALFNDSDKLNVGHSYGIIKDVDAVSTGVADVSIKVLTKDAAMEKAHNSGGLKQPIGATAYGIYTLYDGEGIVIASVVIGEDDGAKDLVYVHSGSLDLESYNSEDDIWTWTRRVVFNGQETTLTEKDSELSELKKMLQFHWYEIKRNADGNVINVEPAYKALGNDFEHEYEEINTTVETQGDTILYQTQDGPKPADDTNLHDHYGFYKEELNVIGTNTLAVTTLRGSGIHFRDNVNVVLQYWNRNTQQTEIETGTGVDRLKSMVDFVNKNTENRDAAHPYYLSAVIEKGFATTIVIYDSFNSYKRPEVSAGSYELTLGGVLNSIYTTPADKNSDVYIVNDDGSISYVESNDDIATSTVNGYKRYTVPYGARIRIYDNDTANNFLPFFSPIKPIYSFYDYYARPTAQRAYIEFTVPSRLDNDKLTIRERMVTDGIYVGVEADAKATITVGGKTYTAGQSVVVYDGQTVTANTTAADAKLYVNGVLQTAPYTWTVDIDRDMEFIISTTGGTVTPPDPIVPDEEFTVTFPEHTGVTVDGTALKSGDKVKKGTVITVDPIDALKVEGATAPNALGECTVTGNVVVTPKTGFKWSNTFEAWVGVDMSTGDLNIVPFGLVSSVFRLARAVEDPAGTVIDTSVDGWCAKMIRDVGATYTIAAGDVVWTATISKSKTTFKLTTGDKTDLVDAIAGIDNCVVTKTKAAGETPVDPTGNRTLTLKGALLATRDTVLDNQPVAVFAGPKGGTMERVTKWELGNQASAAGEVVTANYVIPAGYDVMIRPATVAGGVATETETTITANSIWLVNDEIPVFLNERTTWDDITLSMTKDITVEIKTADTVENAVKVQKVTIGEGVKGNWTATSGKYVKTNEPLVTGVNYVYNGTQTVITFTDNGAGSKIINSTANPYVDSVSGTANIYDAKDTAKNSITGVTAAMSFDSAVKVTLVGTSAVGKINGANAVTAAGNPQYIALGKPLVLSGGSFDGYILGAKAGTPIALNTWKVAPVGTDKDVTIYGGVKVILGEGVSAQWAEASTAKTGIALKNGDCVIPSNSSDSYIINAKTSTGTHVAQILASFTDDAVMTDTPVTAALEWTATNAKYALESVTKVSLYQGKDAAGNAVNVSAAAWGHYPDCRETVFYDKDGIKTGGYKTSAATPVDIYVKTNANIYLKIDGATRLTDGSGMVNDTSKAIGLSVYVGDKKDETVKPDNYYVTFKATGNKAITVRQDMSPSDVKTLAQTISAGADPKGQISVVDNTIHATGNLQYLGGDAQFNKDHSYWTVSGDLGRFLKKLHTTTGYTTAPIYYNGVEYTWGTNALASGQYERLENGKYVTIIEDLVKAAGYGAAADGKSFDITVNGVTLTFTVHLDTTLKTNETTGKQEG